MSEYIEQYCVQGEDGSVLIQMKVPGHGTEDLKAIIGDHLLTWSDLFAYKNAGYGDMADDLGSRAQFVDINRKCSKLRRALWLGQDIGSEGVEEVINDMIGHLFLLQRQLRKERAGEILEETPSADWDEASAHFDPNVVSIRPVVDTDDNARRSMTSTYAEDEELVYSEEACSREPHDPHPRGSLLAACPGFVKM